MIGQLVDMYIVNGWFDKLAEIVVQSHDKAACEKILKRVAELSRTHE